MRVYLLLLFLLTFQNSYGQNDDKLFAPVHEKKEAKRGFLLCANGDFDIPGGDMAKEFGNSFRVGGGVLYKTSSNWLFGAKCDFIVGNTVKVDSLCINIRDKYSGFNGKLLEFINDNGERVGVPVYERGYMIGLTAGKLIPFTERKPDNGLLLLTSGGFMQHKIDIYDRDKNVEQIRGDYLKGYDRLSNGLFFDQYAGYLFLSKNKLINFHLGIDALFAFTQDRRSYLYDVMRTDNKQRLDILFGLRGAWIFTIFKRKSEELSFQ